MTSVLKVLLVAVPCASGIFLRNASLHNATMDAMSDVTVKIGVNATLNATMLSVCPQEWEVHRVPREHRWCGDDPTCSSGCPNLQSCGGHAPCCVKPTSCYSTYVGPVCPLQREVDRVPKSHRWCGDDPSCGGACRNLYNCGSNAPCCVKPTTCYADYVGAVCPTEEEVHAVPEEQRWCGDNPACDGQCNRLSDCGDNAPCCVKPTTCYLPTPPPTPPPAPPPPPSTTLAPTTTALDCTPYVTSQGCTWTYEWNCPGQTMGSKGAATNDGTTGYKCCCEQGMWQMMPQTTPPTQYRMR